MDGRRIKGKTGENEPLYGHIRGEKSNDVFPEIWASTSHQQKHQCSHCDHICDQIYKSCSRGQFFFKKQHCHPCVANWVWALQDTQWQGMFVYGVHEKDWEAKAILWFRSDSVAPADLFSSPTQEMPCLTSMITLFNKDQSMHHPLTFEKGWEGTRFVKVFVESSVYPSHFGR